MKTSASLVRGLGCLFTLTAITACGGGHGAAISPNDGVPRGLGAVARADGTIDVTFAKGADVPITFAAPPGARCTAAGVESTRAFYADPDGQVVIHVVPGENAVTTSSRTFVCTAAGAAPKSVSVVMHLVPGRVPQSARKAPPPDVTPDQVAAAKARYGFDFTTASAADLALHDLPARPDEPHAYLGWLRAVVSPTARVSHKSVVMPDVFHGPITGAARATPSGGQRTVQSTSSMTSHNWSGYEVQGSTYEFETASGEWYVPSVTGTATGEAAMWVGVDGGILNSSTVVLQNGSGSILGYDSTNNVYFTQYFLWEEYYPGPSHALTFSVSAGDDVWCEEQTSNPTSSTASLVYYCKNNTTGFVASGTESYPGSGTFYGNTVEWIVEKNEAYLPDFGTTQMNGAYGAYTANGNWFNYSQVDNVDITLINSSSSTLATSYPPSPGSWSIDWSWYASN